MLYWFEKKKVNLEGIFYWYFFDGVGPGYAPNGSIVLALYLEGAHPLVCQHHITGYLICNISTCCVHCTCVDRSVSEVDVGGPLPDLDVLIAWACCYTTTIVIELYVMDEVIVLQRKTRQFDAFLLLSWALGLLLLWLLYLDHLFNFYNLLTK